MSSFLYKVLCLSVLQLLSFWTPQPYACPLIIHCPRLFVVFHEVYCSHISQYDKVCGVTGLYISAKFHVF